MDESWLDRYRRTVGPEGGNAESVAAVAALEVVRRTAPEVAGAIAAELDDQRANLKLVASENHASLAVLYAMGNWMSDKYAEGSAGHRFYAGCEHVDDIELLGSEKAKALFGADHAYLQPHSGIDANLVAYWAILSTRVEGPALESAGVKNVNDLDDAAWEELRQAFGNQKLMGMALDSGGHLTHGFRPNISGKLFRQCSYGVDRETHQLDYDALAEQARAEQPFLLVAGHSSYPRLLDFRRFREIADEVGAVLMVDMAHFAGLVAGKVLTGDFDPVAHAHVVTSTTHKTLRGPRGGMVLSTEEFAPAIDRGCPLVLGGPLPHVMAAKAVALEEASRPAFREYAASVVANASALAAALVASGMDVVTGGTDNHLLLLRVDGLGLTGRQAENALRAVGITANRNVIPYDANGAWYTSGVRLGTPAVTSRGFTTDDMAIIAATIAEVLHATKPGETKAGEPSRASFRTEDAVAARARTVVDDLVGRHPLYPELDLSTCR